MAGVATCSFVVEILALDLEHPQPTVEADLDLRPVRTADPHLDGAAALALDADYPAGPRERQCRLHGAGSARTAELVRRRPAAAAALLVEAEELEPPAQGHLDQRAVGTRDVGLPLVPVPPGRLRLPRPDPVRGRGARSSPLGSGSRDESVAAASAASAANRSVRAIGVRQLIVGQAGKDGGANARRARTSSSIGYISRRAVRAG
jgi:hypothetical protein